MSSKEGYDVLRLIEHGQSCYISSEYVKGCILAVWLRYHPNLSKDRLLEWIQDITRQLGLIHRCRGNPCYRYVNPYSIIVTQEGQLHFLDMDAKSNEEQLRFMQKGNQGAFSSAAAGLLPEGKRPPGHLRAWKDDPVYIVGGRSRTAA